MRTINIATAVITAIIGAAPINAALAAPTCDVFRARLANAASVLEIDAPIIRTFREPDGFWQVMIGGWEDASVLYCDKDGKVGSFLIALPWSLATATSEQLDMTRNMAAIAIYAYTGWNDPNKIINLAQDVCFEKAKLDRDEKGFKVDDGRIRITLIGRIAVVLAGPN